MRLLGVLLLVPISQLASADGVATMSPSRSAIAAAERACKADDAAACTRAARLHVDAYFGRDGGNTRDWSDAKTLYRRGCELHDAPGCTGVAWLLLEVRDYAHALPILEESCRGGDPAACSLIADALAPGNGLARDQGVPEDLSRALTLYDAACTAAKPGDGCTSGCNALGSLHYYGRQSPTSNAQVSVDRAKAASYYDRACTLGCINSCDTLGDMQRTGDGIPVEPARAAKNYEKACKTGPFAPSCMSLSELYRTGTGVPKNAATAKALFMRACRLSGNQVNGCPSD